MRLFITMPATDLLSITSFDSGCVAVARVIYFDERVHVDKLRPLLNNSHCYIVFIIFWTSREAVEFVSRRLLPFEASLGLYHTLSAMLLLDIGKY